MKKFIALPAVLLAGCLPSEQPREVVVTGEAVIERTPDVFEIGGSIRERGKTQKAVLAAASAKVDAIRDALPRLEGASHLTIEASQASVRAVQDPECLEKSGYRGEDSCPVTGYFAVVSLDVEGSPTARAGAALSALSELGAEQVALRGYSISDQSAARREAIAAAVADARAKAEAMAGAAGARLAGPVRLQYGGGAPYAVAQTRASGEMIMADKAYAPEVDLQLDPGPVEIRENVSATFAIVAD